MYFREHGRPSKNALWSALYLGRASLALLVTSAPGRATPRRLTLHDRHVLAAVAAILVFVFILWLLRRGVLKEKYAVLWLLRLRGRRCFFALVPGALGGSPTSSASRSPSNLLFFVTLVLLILVSVQLSYELSRHEAKIRRLAEESPCSDGCETRGAGGSPT